MRDKDYYRKLMAKKGISTEKKKSSTNFKRITPITKDDITNLKIDLEGIKSIDQFISKL
jgi:hypothetical protein